MPFDYLKNSVTEEEKARRRTLFLSDPEAGLSACREALKLSKNAATYAKNAEKACRRTLSERLSRFSSALDAAAKSLPTSESIFRTAADAKASEAVLHSLRVIEAAHRALVLPSPSFSAVLQAYRDFEAVAQETARLLHISLAASNGCDAQTVCREMVAEHERETEVCRRSVADLRRWQTAWIELCGERIPRFLGEWMRASDAEHMGAACNTPKLRRLCGEMRFALTQIKT